jgi:hypothetical protein
MKRILKPVFVVALMLLSLDGVYAYDKPALPPLPGMEYLKEDADGKIQKRKWRDVKVSDLVEGSLEWVVRQEIVMARKRDFKEMAKYVSASELKNVSGQDPKTLAALVEFVNIDTIMAVGDCKIEEDRAYVYIKLQSASGGSWYGSYRYFLKPDGQWIRVSSSEWQHGKCK